MSLLRTVMNWVNQQDVDCQFCNHPAGTCSGGCSSCLNEIHYWHNNQNPIRRISYDCNRLAFEYVKSYTERYYKNILVACDCVDFSRYDSFSILSIGCGASPDLMAFEEIATDKHIFYRGIDRTEQWEEFHDLICEYTRDKDIFVDYQQSDIFIPEPSVRRDEIFNVAVLQFVISSIWCDLAMQGQKRSVIENQVKNIFYRFIDTALLRWRNSNCNTPFLVILNDNDSVNTGRKQLYDFLDILVDRGYFGSAHVRSMHVNDDMDDRNNKLFDGFEFYTSRELSNNSASLTIEVIK